MKALDEGRREEARALARRPYSVRLERDEGAGETTIFVASHPELPGCMAQGRSREQAVSSLIDATEDYILSLLNDGVPVPEPALTATGTVGGYSPQIKWVPKQGLGGFLVGNKAAVAAEPSTRDEEWTAAMRII